MRVGVRHVLVMVKGYPQIPQRQDPKWKKKKKYVCVYVCVTITVWMCSSHRGDKCAHVL